MSTKDVSDGQFDEETGLNLFDDTASAAGSFTHSMWGYDRTSVDNYVREIEQQVSTLKQLTRHLRGQVSQAQAEATQTDFKRLGVHATEILTAAEAQAKDIVAMAGNEAERIKEEGRRVVADMRAAAQTESDDIRVAGLANQHELRDQAAKDSRTAVEQARLQARTIVEQAETHAEAIVTEARTKASVIDQNARAQVSQIIEKARSEAAEITESARHDAAEITQKAREETAAVTAEARASHDQAMAKINELLEQAKAHQQASSDTVTKRTEEADTIRQSALEEAESTRNQAARDAENRIATAHRQAAMMKERLEEQYAWRKEQLERETAALLQRKKAVLAQLSNLKALAGEAESAYPDTDPFAEQSEADSSEDATIVIDPKPRTDGMPSAAKAPQEDQATQVLPATKNDKAKDGEHGGATTAQQSESRDSEDDESDNEKTQVLPQGSKPEK